MTVRSAGRAECSMTRTERAGTDRYRHRVNLASMVGNALWNRMSKLLPLTLVGQMILFETLFALIYGFLWEQRLPTDLEYVAFTLVVLSVVSCLAVHAQPRRNTSAP